MTSLEGACCRQEGQHLWCEMGRRKLRLERTQRGAKCALLLVATERDVGSELVLCSRRTIRVVTELAHEDVRAGARDLMARGADRGDLWCSVGLSRARPVPETERASGW